MIQIDHSDFSFKGPNWVGFYPYYGTLTTSKDFTIIMHSKVLVGDGPHLVSSRAEYIEKYGQLYQNFPHTLVVHQALDHLPYVYVVTVPEDVPLDVALWKLADSDYEHAEYLAEDLQSICPRQVAGKRRNRYESDSNYTPPDTTPFQAFLAFVAFFLLTLWSFNIICMNCSKG